jgi:hypothetical protein
MAETDMKPLSELDLYNNKLDSKSLLPMTVNLSGSNVTRKVYFNNLKVDIVGYELVGTLTAGSTSITLSSTGTEYNQQTTYAIGDRVIYEAKNYICVEVPTGENRTWDTDAHCFVEYNLLDSNSTIRIFTTVFGVNPTAASISNNAITLTFEEQNADIGVKVRVG